MGFVLIHSPLLGPSSWSGVAEALGAAGHRTLLPDLRSAAAAPVVWRAQLDEAVAAIDQAFPSGSHWIVGHSGAGALLPSIGLGLGGRSRGYVFVDAVLPHPGRSRFDVLPEAFVARVRSLAADGMLPPWTEWFGPGVIEQLVPDAAQREHFCAEVPTVPITMFEEHLPAVPGWPDAPCYYLQLSPAYAAETGAAVARDWRTTVRHGDHLSILSDPIGVTESILTLTQTKPDSTEG